MAKLRHSSAGKGRLRQLNVLLPEQLVSEFNSHCDEHGYIRSWVMERVLSAFLGSGGVKVLAEAIPNEVMEELAVISRAHHDVAVGNLVAKAVREFIDRETASDPRTAEAMAGNRNRKPPSRSLG